MRIFINFLFILCLCVGCTSLKKGKKIIVTQTETKIEYRDSLIYIKDTVYFPLPVEEKSNVTIDDSSHLETSVAMSDAWIDDDGALNHTLKNKTDTVFKYVYDTIVKVEYINKYIEKPVICEVEIPKPYIPKIGWLCIIFTIGFISIKIGKIFLKR
jgi:hypothetical protein